MLKQRRQNLDSKLLKHSKELIKVKPVSTGKLIRVVGLTLEASGCEAPLNSICLVETHTGNMLTEVVGFNNNLLSLMPIDELKGVYPGAKVTPIEVKNDLPVGNCLLGRIVNGNCEPIDGQGRLTAEKYISRQTQSINPLTRQGIDSPLDVGVRAINSMFSIGKGQRMGLFAGSGVGKSVLLGMMTKGTSADIIVVALVGERGREVKEFIDDILGKEGRNRAVVVAAPADSSPLMRLRACETATRLAEYYREQGKDVLLLMDSLTRYAQAQREIALAVGEPPATKGYPPSVFAKLPRLVERAGRGDVNQGSITAFYTVLTENDDLLDPIADACRAILDGHIVLSRELADSGHYPAIDIEASISRLAPTIVSEAHFFCIQQVKKTHSLYQANRDLISIGAYTQGSDKNIDNAIRLQPAMNAFLCQSMKQVVNFEESERMLSQLAQQCQLTETSDVYD